MKAKYVGETFYDGLGLTDGKIYNIIKDEGSFYRVVDDSGEDYLYSKSNPAHLTAVLKVANGN